MCYGFPSSNSHICEIAYMLLGRRSCVLMNVINSRVIKLTCGVKDVSYMAGCNIGYFPIINAEVNKFVIVCSMYLGSCLLLGVKGMQIIDNNFPFSHS